MDSVNLRDNIANLENMEENDRLEDISVKRKKINEWSGFAEINSKFETVILVESGDEYLEGFEENAIQEMLSRHRVGTAVILENYEQNKIVCLQKPQESNSTETNNNNRKKNNSHSKKSTIKETKRKKSRKHPKKKRTIIKTLQKNAIKKAVNATCEEEEAPTYAMPSQKFLALIEKSNADYEQQNILLENQIEKVMKYIGKIEKANDELNEEFKLFDIFSQQIENRLVQAFAELPIPNEPYGANSVNICRYMTNLHTLHTSGNSDLVQKVKNLVGTIDINVNLSNFL